MKTINKIISFAVFFGLLVNSLFSAPSYDDVVLKGDRNLKVINVIYEKYPFMPAKRAYFQQISDVWIKSKTAYFNSSPEGRKEKFAKFLKAYENTNDVLKDICIDMANYSDVIIDDMTQKLIDSETKKVDVKHGKFYNRYLVSKNEFARADNGFKKRMYYYSARLYDHGIEVMMSIYKDAGWNFPKGKPAQPRETLS